MRENGETFLVGLKWDNATTYWEHTWPRQRIPQLFSEPKIYLEPSQPSQVIRVDCELTGPLNFNEPEPF